MRSPSSDNTSLREQALITACPLGRSIVNVQFRGKHVVFHVHNDYVTRQAKHFGLRNKVAD